MFERFVSGKRRNWRRRALIIGSLVVHGGAVAALVLASWFQVTEIQAPMLAIAFFSSPPPQGATPPRTAPKRQTHPAVRRAQPSVTAPEPPTAQEPPEAPGTPDPGDQPPGPPGPPAVGPPGIGSRNIPCEGANCVTAPPPRPRNVAPHALDAQRISGLMPHLPASVAGTRKGLGDTPFTARLCVDTSGAISSVTVLAGIPGADADIVEALRGWRYKPQPIPVCFITQLIYDVE